MHVKRPTHARSSTESLRNTLSLTHTHTHVYTYIHTFMYAVSESLRNVLSINDQLLQKVDFTELKHVIVLTNPPN